MTRRITADTLKARLREPGELALLDVREQGSYGQAHLLYASNAPLSRLELLIADLVPRAGTPIVLCDGGEGLAERAAERLAALGYPDTAVLEGGVEAWRAAGYELFSGVYVPSKAFGEFVEHTYGTPSLGPEELKARMDRGEKLVVLDSRPLEEYEAMSIPGGIDVPGAELVYRVRDLAPEPDTTVVVNCAGRTRSIIGAQSLINAGVPNPVVALRNGTMGWHLAGLELERGQRRRAPDVSAEGLAWARQATARVRERFGVQTVSPDTLADWRAEADAHTLYLLDVRNPEEYAAGHLPGSRPAPGGQLVQATDTYVATRGARVVLVDDTEVRAVMTASWLVQMGWRNVYVLEGGVGSARLQQGRHQPAVPGLRSGAVPALTLAALEAALQDGGAVVLDFARSLDFQRGHIPGAWFAIRARLGEALAAVPGEGPLVFTCPDGRLAHLAAQDAAGLTARPVQVLEGGTAAWQAEGRPMESGERHACEPDDVYLRPYDRSSGVEDAMQQYLSWEVELVRQIERDGDARFVAVPG